jgi:hypothetical protein
MGYIKNRWIESMEPKPHEWDRRWIPASERLPSEFGKDVLVFVFDNTDPEVKYQAIGSFERGEGWHVTGYDRTTVTQWMPMPEPPA